MNKIYYWEQALILKDLVDYQTLLQDVLQKLMNAEYASAGLEQIQHGPQSIYSARINDKARVIFTNFEKMGQKTILILDVLKNHEYERCHFLDKHYIRHFFGNLNPEQLSKAPIEHPAIFKNEPSADGFYFQKIHYFQNQWIELSPNQHEAMQVRLPALIEGEAGSGKTCVGLCALSDYLNHHDAEQVQVLYLAPFAHLTSEMQRQWQGLNGHPNAQFKTYDEFFTKEALSTKHLTQWIYRKQAFPETDSYKLLQEFSLLQLLDDEAEYQSLGERETIFPREQKTKVWQLFQDFKCHFNFTENSHPWFSPLPVSAIYDLIYLDESQSFNAFQLAQILSLAKERALLMGFDRHQRISADKRDLLQFKRLCHKNHILLESVQLHGSFRCPKKVIHLVNNILSIKYALAKGRPDKGSILKYESQKEETGQIQYFLESKDKKQFVDALPQGSRNWAVVTPLAHRSKARELFDTPLIFSPQECLGLGYDVIVLYYMGQQGVIEAIAKELPIDMQKSYLHGARVELKEEYIRSLNEWLIAVSRAQNTILIIEPSIQKTHKIRQFHQHLFHGELLETHPHAMTKIEADEDWENEVLKLLSTGQNIQAEEAYQRYVYPKTQVFLKEWLENKTPQKQASESMSFPKEAPTPPSRTTFIQKKSSPEKPKATPQTLQHPEKAIQVTQNPVTIISRIKSASLYQNLLKDLPHLHEAENNRSLYHEKYMDYFKMRWTEWVRFIQEPERLNKMTYMLKKYAHIQNIFQTESHEDLFLESEDYTEFLQYQLTLSKPPMICEFNQRLHMLRLCEEILRKPNFIHLPFLNFLVKNEYVALMATVRTSSIEQIIRDATIYYFNQLTKNQIKKNKKPHFDYFISYIALGVGISYGFYVETLIDTLITQPQLWSFMDVTKWSSTRIENGIFSNLMLEIFNTKQGLKLIKILILNQHLSYHDLFSVVLNDNMFLTSCNTIFEDVFLTQSLFKLCIVESDIYDTFRSIFSQKNHMHLMFKYRKSFEAILLLLGTHTNFWSQAFDSGYIYLFKNKDNNHQISLILKILVDAQKINDPNFHQMILNLFLSGKPAFLDIWSDEEWLLPMSNYTQNSATSFSWMISPLIIMTRFQIYHPLLELLIDKRPTLLQSIKRLLTEETIPKSLIEESLNQSQFGRNILKKMERQTGEASPFILFELNNQLFIHEEVLTFFQPAPAEESSIPGIRSFVMAR